MDSTRQYTEPDTKGGAWTTFDVTLKLPLKVQLLHRLAMIVCLQLVVLHSHLNALQQYYLDEQHLDFTNSSATAMTHQSNYSQQNSNARRDCVWTLLGNTQNQTPNVNRPERHSTRRLKLSLTVGTIARSTRVIVCLLLVVLHSHLKALQQYHLETKQHLNSTNFSATQRRHTNLIILNKSQMWGLIDYGLYSAIHRTRHQVWLRMNDIRRNFGNSH